jgi:hypothetical protein
MCECARRRIAELEAQLATCRALLLEIRVECDRLRVELATVTRERNEKHECLVKQSAVIHELEAQIAKARCYMNIESRKLFDAAHGIAAQREKGGGA